MFGRLGIEPPGEIAPLRGGVHSLPRSWLPLPACLAGGVSTAAEGNQ